MTPEEIQTSIFDIRPHRSPGPYGFSALFYHKHWNDLRTEIVGEVTRFFDEGTLYGNLNHTN